MGAEPKRRGGNLVALGVSQLFRMGAGVAVNVLLMRGLGVDGFGVYGTVMTVVGLAAFGAGLGMNRLINREVARDAARAGPMVATGLAATAGLALATALPIVGWAALFDGRPEVVLAAALGALALALQSLAAVPEAAFHATRQMAFSARGQVLGRVALVATTAALLWFEVGVVAVFVGQVLDGLITFAVTFALFRRVVGTRGFQTSLSAVRALTREALPFGLNALFGSVYLSVDVLLLAMMKGDTEVGVYRGAVMLISLFPVVANTLTTGVYPRMARHVGHPDRAGAELRFVHRVLLAISVPAAVGGMLLAEPLMVFIGGDAFAVSALPFLILCPLLPLRFVNNGSAMTLSTLDRQGDRTRGVMLAAALNLAANFVVIPTYGAAGAAATTLATEVALALWFRWRIGPLVEGLGLPQNVARAAAPAAAMAAALWALPDWHVVAQVAVGAAVFAAVGLVSGAWHPRDLKQLRSV